MNNCKGISLIALIVTIIVTIILAAIFIRVGTTDIDSSIETRNANEKKELETAIIKRFADYSLNSSAYPLVGSTVVTSELSSIEGITIADAEYIRKVNSSDIQSLGVKNTTGNKYIVDYLDGKVYGPVQ